MLSNDIEQYFAQSPYIPLILSLILLFTIILQCFAKKRFYKVRFILSFLLVFASIFVLIFYGEIKEDPTALTITNYCFLALDAAVFIILITTLDFSISNEMLQKELTRSLDETKFFVLLDKKDRVKDISELFVKDLGIEPHEAIGKNIFDVIEMKYYIVGLNGADVLKNDVKKYYAHYGKRAEKGTNSKIELLVQTEDAAVNAIYFNESVIFSGEKYKGRVLIGDKKNEETLIGMEAQLESANTELDLLKERFVTLIGKTNDGIFFNYLNKKVIWFNDILVKRLLLNGNSLDAAEFYRNIHPEDIAYYQEVMGNLKNEDYSITYRYNTGAYYVYVKEMGHKIVNDKTIELCGIMSILDDVRYEKTETALDSVGNENEMQVRFKQLLATDQVFEVVYFKMDSIPEINEACGRAIGNMMMAQYVSVFRDKFITDNLLFRVAGLEFVAFITNYNRMESLKTNLRNEEKILHLTAEYAGQKILCDVKMGLTYSNDTTSPKDSINNAKRACKIAQNEQFTSSFAYFRDLR